MKNEIITEAFLLSINLIKIIHVMKVITKEIIIGVKISSIGISNTFS
jgi:hypothetical protein